MTFDDINRGAITLSPNVNEEWLEGLLQKGQELEKFHVCDMVKNHDGSIFVLFCDGDSCPETK